MLLSWTGSSLRLGQAAQASTFPLIDSNVEVIGSALVPLTLYVDILQML